MRLVFRWLHLILAAIVVVGVWLQVYFIAAYFFDAEAARDVHELLGYSVVHPAEILAFLVAFGAWPRDWGKIGHSFGLAALGTIQIALTGGDAWIGGLHGVLALAVLVMAVFIVKWNAEALGLMGGRRAELVGAEPPPPPP